MKARILTIAYFITTTCNWVVGFFIPLKILSTTNSSIWMSLGYMASMAPYILVTPFAGVWSDRYNRKKFLVSNEFLGFLIICVIYNVITSAGGSPAPIYLICLLFALACLSATQHPIFQGMAPELLQDDELANFNSNINIIDNFVRIGAPVAVAALLGLLNEKTILAITAGGCLVSMLLLTSLPQSSKATGVIKRGILSDLLHGLRFVFNDKNLMSFSILFFFVNFGLTIIGANLAFIFRNSFGVPPSKIGYYYAILGAGAVLGSLIARKLIKKFSSADVIIISCAAAGALAIVTCLAKSALVFSAVWAISSGCQSIVVVTFFTFRQTVVPRDLLGRTVGITRLISYLAIPPASVVGGLLMARVHSFSLVMAIGGISIILGSLVAGRAPAFRLKMYKSL